MDNSTLNYNEIMMIKSLNIDLMTIGSLKRRSEKEYDFSFSYRDPETGWDTTAWLPLAVIQDSKWTYLAHMSDYPEMVLDGDWSGIRDSSKEAIWKMFDYIVN